MPSRVCRYRRRPALHRGGRPRWRYRRGLLRRHEPRLPDSERLRAVPRSSEATSTDDECSEPEARAPEVDKPEFDDPGGDDPEVVRPEVDNPEIGTVRFDESLGSAASSFSDDEHPSPPMPPALTVAPAADARRDESGGTERSEHDSDDAIGAEPRAQREGQDA